MSASPASSGRILVLRGGAIGDFILTLPVLAALRSTFPGNRLEVLGYPHIASLALAAGLVDAAQPIEARALAGYGCKTRMHVVRLLAPPVAGEDYTKDIDFSPAGIRERWDAGYRDTSEVLARRPWNDPHDPLEGFILHEAEAGHMIS